MDVRIAPRLRCPVSGKPLELVAIETERHDERELVRTGILHCRESNLWFPIINHVPVMVTFRTRLVERFRVEHAAALAGLSGAMPPDLPPMPGEISIQKTFTEEWGGLGDDDRTFLYSDAELTELHRDVWLRMDAGERAEVDLVMDVGCGFGKEALILADLFPAADVMAVDLNLALLRAGSRLDRHGRVHPVIASLFRLPFAPSTFGHVHCQGVLHHTWSTRAGFDAIARFPRVTGTLFIWVYALEDSLAVGGMRGAVIRAYWLLSHRVGRPILSRLPPLLRNASMIVLAGILHPLIKARDRRPADWRFANTLHGLRDAFTPRYAHQHGLNEVATWFEDAGFEPRLQSPARYRTLIGKRLIGVGMIGRRQSLPGEPR